MDARRQYRVLYRDFVFRIVDRELLSSHAKGDASQLLLQVLTLLLGVSVLLALPALLDWTDTSMELIAASVLLMACAVAGARLTFAMPRDLQANWIFRMLPGRDGAQYMSAKRRTLIVLAAGPVWVVSAAVFLVQWPWAAAAQHLVVLALVGAILVEFSLWGTTGIPFTCAYLPGGSRAHVGAPVAVVLCIVTLILADSEAQVLRGEGGYPMIVGALALAWAGARWRTSWTASGVTAPALDEAPGDQAVTLDS